MRAAWALALLSALPLPSARAASARGLTLDEAYALALKKSEELAQRGETVAELEARVSELWSNVKPRVSLVGSQTWQDSPPSDNGFSNSFTQRSRPEARVAGHQPLFSGFREFLAVRAAKAQGEAAELSLARARQLVYRDVAAAYLDLLGLHKELAIRQSLLALTQDRIQELTERRALGRSRHSEVLAAESQLAAARADLEEARGREEGRQWRLRFLTGLEEELRPAEVPVPGPERLEAFLDRSRSRPDVEGRRREGEAARLSVGVQSRQRWPTVSLDGNYYLKRPKGFLEDIKWDAAVSATLPLYAGGSISAQTREARARARAAEAALALALRTAELEVRSEHSALSSGLSAVKALEEAVARARANARAQAEDYRHGLVTNLEVLSSQNSEQEARLRLEGARLSAALARARLEVAAGGPQ